MNAEKSNENKELLGECEKLKQYDESKIFDLKKSKFIRKLIDDYLISKEKIKDDYLIKK